MIPSYYLKSFPYLLVQEGKHGNKYYYITSAGDLAKACQKIFESNLSYYPNESCRELENKVLERKRDKVSQLEEAVGQLTNEDINADFKQQLRLARYSLQESLDVLTEIDTVARIKAGDPQYEVASFVFSRSDFEYEKISREQFQQL